MNVFSAKEKISKTLVFTGILPISNHTHMYAKSYHIQFYSIFNRFQVYKFVRLSHMCAEEKHKIGIA